MVCRKQEIRKPILQMRLVCTNQLFQDEIRRNSGDRGYRPQQAHKRAMDTRQHAKKHIKFTSELKKIVTEKILLDWSPDQISGYLILPRFSRHQYVKLTKY